MAFFKSLKDLQKNVEKPAGGGERVQKFLTVPNGKNFKIRFRQELTEDSANYDEEAGTAGVFFVHTNPGNFRKSAVCTKDRAEFGYSCWACEQTTDRGWKSKQHLLINIAYYDDAEKKWEPRIYDQKFTGAHTADAVVEFASEYGTIVDRDYKFSRTGEKQQTSYNLIPLAVKDADSSIDDLIYHDLDKVYRVISPAEQPAYYLEDEDKSDSSGWG